MSDMAMMVTISAAAGIFAAGCVWLGHDFAYKLYCALKERRRKRKLQKDADALLEQAEATEKE